MLNGKHQRQPVAELHTFHRNARRGNIDAIADSLRANHQYRPIVVNAGTHTGRPMEVLAGNHTLMAARRLAETDPEWAEIDTWVIDVDDDAAARIVVADNRTADLGDYDQAQLLELLQSLDGLDGTGYTDDDLADLFAEMTEAEEVESQTDPDEVPDPPTDPIAAVGDVWELGEHRLLVGDSTDVAAVENMMDGDRADMVWTDPPYGVSYVGKTKDGLTIQNDGSAGLAELLAGAFATIMVAAKPGAPVYIAHADTERRTFETAMHEAGMLVRQNLVWVKNTLVLGRSDYHYRHEPILYGFTPGGQGRLGRGGDRWFGDDSQTTVLEFDKPPANRDHPTMKPTTLIGAMLANSCPRGGVVLDPFGGSGSTLIAAHHHRARARLVELDPRYADVICRRFQEHTGTMPIRDGKPYDFKE